MTLSKHPMPRTKPLPDLCQYDKAECAPKGRASKDKRHWCKGKVGVRHKAKWENKSYSVNITRPYSIDWKEFVCVVCSKCLESHHRPWRKKDEVDAEYIERCKKAWEDKQADAKRRLAYYLEFVD